MRAREQQTVACGTGARSPKCRERCLPEALVELGCRRIQPVGTRQFVATISRAKLRELLVENGRLVGRVLTKREEGRWRATAADTDVNATAGEQVGDGRIFGNLHRIFQRQRDDAGGETNRCGVRTHMSEKHEG